MLAARCQGWSAFAVPGDDAWQPGWARLLEGRRVTIVMDADQAGRAAAARIAADLVAVAREVRVAELHPGREDGADLTDWLIANRDASASERRARLARTANLVSAEPSATQLEREREAALRAPLDRCEPVLGAALVRELAGGLQVAWRGLADAGESELRVALAHRREAWRALDQARAREALALTGEQQRTTAVLAGVHACITEITNTPTDLGADAVAAAENARGRQLPELHARVEQLQARGALIAERLDALCERDATPERWAHAHARAFLQGVAAREILHARQLTQEQQGGRARPREHNAASATAPAVMSAPRLAGGRATAASAPCARAWSHGSASVAGHPCEQCATPGRRPGTGRAAKGRTLGAARQRRRAWRASALLAVVVLCRRIVVRRGAAVGRARQQRADRARRGTRGRCDVAVREPEPPSAADRVLVLGLELAPAPCGTLNGT
jgi:hypothetical protein